jgi:hypothetical protein
MIIAFVRFNFDWMIVCVVAMGLSVANVVGYTKCSSDAKSKAQMAQVRRSPFSTCAVVVCPRSQGQMTSITVYPIPTRARAR